MAKKSKRRSPPARKAAPKAPPRKNGSLSTILKQQGLFEGLKLCLDAGDRDSYPGSGPEWHDTSGNGYRFLLGSNVGGRAPEFHGNAGKLSSSEYWSFDGAGKFTYDGVNESWMQNLHKAGAKAWGAAWVWLGATQLQGLLGNSAGMLVNAGFVWACGATLDHGILVNNDSGSRTAINQNAGGSGLAADQWHFLAFSINEAVGTDGLVFLTDGNAQSRTSTYNAPAIGDATWPCQIGSRGGNNAPLSAGSRLAMFCMGEGVAPSGKQLLALRDATRGRFGL
jgi:hypothetical protein